MADIYLFIFIIIITAALSRVLWKPELIFEYPYFMAAVFAVFVLPQASSLIHYPGRVSDTAVDDVLLMSCLCFGASILGYQISPSKNLFKLVSRPVNQSRVFHIALFFIACGYITLYLVRNADVQLTAKGGMTGISTIYIFFGGLVFHGFAICWFLFLQKFTWPRLMAVIVGAIIPLLTIIKAGRREPAVMFGLTIVIGYYYNRGIKPSRFLIFGALFFALLAIPATGVYRGLAAQGELDKLMHFNWIQNFKDYFNKESVLELRNAAALIQTTKSFGDYEYGAGYWNQLIFRFVPAQIVGKDVKDSLLIGTALDGMLNDVTNFGHEFSTGSTLTGMGDAFRQFGWFGCLFFMFVAIIFRSYWLSSIQPNALFAQLLYLLICTSAMRAVTHQTLDFLPGFVYHFLFLWIGLWYAEERNPVTPKSLPNIVTQGRLKQIRGSRIPSSRPQVR